MTASRMWTPQIPAAMSMCYKCRNLPMYSYADFSDHARYYDGPLGKWLDIFDWHQCEKSHNKNYTQNDCLLWSSYMSCTFHYYFWFLTMILKVSALSRKPAIHQGFPIAKCSTSPVLSPCPPLRALICSWLHYPWPLVSTGEEHESPREKEKGQSLHVAIEKAL